MGRLGAQRVRSLVGRLRLEVCLALAALTIGAAAARVAAAPATTARAQSGDERPWAIVLRHAASPSAESEATLDELFADVDERVASGSADKHAAIARILLLVHFAGDEIDADERAELREAVDLAAVSAGRDEILYRLFRLAEEYFLGGAPSRSELVIAFGTDTDVFPEREARLSAASLWHLASEIARKRGEWSAFRDTLENEERIVRAELERAAAQPGGGDPRAAKAQASRIASSRAVRFFELGILDQATDELARAKALAEESGRPSALAAAALNGIDASMLAQDAEGAVARAAEARASEWLAGLPRETIALFDLYEGTALLEVERADARGGLGSAPGKMPAVSRAARMLDAALAVGSLGANERLNAHVSRADLAIERGEAEDVERHLAAARELVSALSKSADPPLRERAMLDVLEWQWGARTGADDLDERRARLARSFDATLAQFASTERRPGGSGFLHSWRRFVVEALVRATLFRAPGPTGDDAAARGEDEFVVGGGQVRSYEHAGEDQRERALEYVLQVEALGTLARREHYAAGDIRSIRERLLAPGRGLLVYLPGRNGTFLFVVDRDSIDVFELDSRDNLRRRVKRFAANGTRAAAVDRVTAREVLLPDPVLERISGWREVLVDNLSLLDAVELENVTLPGEDERAFGQRFAVSNLPSVPWALARAAASPPRESRSSAAEHASDPDLLLLVAPRPADTSTGAEALRFGDAERERLVAPLDPRRVRVVPNATLETLEAEGRAWGAIPIVHVLAHGAYFGERERGAALLFGGPDDDRRGRLFPEDVERALSLGGVVILSACGAGMGPPRMGDDNLAHLGGAFLAAGARCVILAREQVTYGQALDTFERVHARLAAGDSVAEALRRSRDRGDVTAFQVLGLGFEAPLGER